MGLGKVELHLHLDGSLDLECAYRLAKERKVIDEDYTFEAFKERMIVPSDNPSLYDCLKCFDFPNLILQDKEALSESTYCLIRNLAKEGLIYAEIRFAPQIHIQKGMTQAEAVEAVLEGRERALKDYPEIKANIICCSMTYGDASKNMEANLETVRVTKKYLGQGVVALDLAGGEGLCPMLDFKPVFDLAKELGVPYTIHAGEAGPASFVNDAMNMGASRIGHGGNSIQDKEVMKRVIDSQIMLEFCVTSNIQCHVQPSYEQHAMIELYKNGANVCLNSDNMTLSDVTINTEIEHALNEMGFTEEDILKMNRNAIKAAFISEEEKAELLAKL